jgi:hypothetical protein
MLGLPVDKVYEYLSNLAKTITNDLYYRFYEELIASGILLVLLRGILP